LTIAKELTKYKLHLLGVQKVTQDRRRTEPTEYTFFYVKKEENRELGIGFCIKLKKSKVIPVTGLAGL
jgi:hypothetical protein